MTNNLQEQSTSFEKKDIYWPVFIPKKFISKIMNPKTKSYFFILELANKEVFIPFAWLKEHPSGKGYVGKLKLDMELSGQVKTPTKINTNEWVRFFPMEKLEKK